MEVRPVIFDNPEIFSEEFPDDVSVSDLCDCGRHKRRRLPGFSNKLAQKHKGEFGNTDYKSTFKPIKNVRPRSSKRPPPSPRDPNPPPMTLVTNQRTEFTKPSNPERVVPYKPEEYYEPPSDPFATDTFYKKEYTPKVVFPEICQASPRTETLRLSSAKFDPTTTSKSHYKRWVSQPCKSFAELPSFADSIIFPNKENLPDSVTRETYVKQQIESTEPAKPAPTTLKIEGTMVFDTTHGKTYRKISGHHRPDRVRPPTEMPINWQKRGKFQSETQFRRDFPGFGGHQPPPPDPAEPPKTTVNLKLHDKRRSFSTEQRAIYKGHDVKTFPVAKSFKKDEEEYKPPSIKFETETSQKRDFQPIDFNDVYPVPSIVPVRQLHTTNDAKFDDHTMSKEFFKKWPVQERVRYGDFHENKAYVPPQIKFEGESESHEKFQPKTREPITNYKPEFKTMDTNGEMYLRTSYSDEYKGHKIKLCRAQVYLLQQQFKKWQKEQAELTNAQAVVAV
ncbi:hypothetical protein SNE40_016668 [Patella caerulea]|uniref:Uncharacterized protein n=1 Tax=Patella caerulea TaxID=87958 RepID=A0AAN8PNW3_PATCE